MNIALEIEFELMTWDIKYTCHHHLTKCHYIYILVSYLKIILSMILHAN